MRDFYFDTKIDLGSSGVQSWSLSELRQLLGIHPSELDALTFDDSESYGGRELREALVVRFGAGDTDRIMATHGFTEAIFAAMNALLTSGDEVVVVDPAHHSLQSVAEAIGCRIKRWRLRPEDGFRPCLDTLRPLLTSRTRMVVVNFPHNPTGATLTRDQAAHGRRHTGVLRRPAGDGRPRYRRRPAIPARECLHGRLPRGTPARTGTLVHIAAADRRDGGAFVPELWLPYVGGELVRHVANCTHEEMTRPEVLAHIGPRPAAHIDRAGPVDGADR
ncbi:hypothetical protein B1C81_29970 [Streptomyces sp. HG99]|nr:hypothetical protein B1C81_29970 [Streptomyces sp. HG99]